MGSAKPLKRAKKGSVGTRITLRVSDEVAAELEKRAKRAGISQVELIRRALAAPGPSAKRGDE